jgi:hypothetical protein
MVGGKTAQYTSDEAGAGYASIATTQSVELPTQLQTFFATGV